MSANSSDAARRQAGFTLIELVAVILILGILAVLALPKLNTSEYRAFAFREQVQSALRHAQKSAVSHRRMVCAIFTSNSAGSSVRLMIAQASGAPNCAYDFLLATGGTAEISATASFAPLPAKLYFQPDGRITSDGSGSTVVTTTVTVAGANSISLVGATGYVN